MTLTTNDVRVLRLLHARARTHESIGCALGQTNAGAAPALRRIPSLTTRGLIRDRAGIGRPEFEITPDGTRQLAAADTQAIA